MIPPYGSPPWLILAAIEDGGSCPVTADSLWRSLAAPLHRSAAPRWGLAEHAAYVEQLIGAGCVLRLPDGRLVGARVALLAQVCAALEAA